MNINFFMYFRRPNMMIILFRTSTSYCLDIGKSFRPLSCLFPRSSLRAPLDLFLIYRHRGIITINPTLPWDFARSSRQPGCILHRSHLPNITDVIYEFIDEETQCCLLSPAHLTTTTALATSHSSHQGSLPHDPLK